MKKFIRALIFLIPLVMFIVASYAHEENGIVHMEPGFKFYCYVRGPFPGTFILCLDQDAKLCQRAYLGHDNTVHLGLIEECENFVEDTDGD